MAFGSDWESGEAILKHYEQSYLVFRPFYHLFRPIFFGVENVPVERPVMLVTNHPFGGVFAGVLLLQQICLRRRVVVRTIAHPQIFQNPLLRLLARYGGLVDGSQETLAKVLQMGHSIHTTPGGTREAWGRRPNRYDLNWKEDPGFARFAIKQECPILPAVVVGLTDAFDIVLSHEDILASAVGPWLRRFGLGKAVRPIVRGIGPTPIPRPERLYFQVCSPIETAPYKRWSDESGAERNLLEKTKESLNGAIDSLLSFRRRDPERSVVRRLQAAVKPNGDNSPYTSTR